MNMHPNKASQAAEFDDRSPYADPAAEEQSIDIGAIIRFIRRRIVLIAGIGFSLTLLAALVIYQLTPRYTATALLYLNPPQQNVIDFEAVLSGGGNDSAAIGSEIELIRSRTLARQVIIELNLMNDPEISPIEETSWFSPRAWIADIFAEPSEVTSEEVDALRMNQAIERLIDMQTVAQRPSTRLIEVSITSEDPKKAANISNALVDAYTNSQIEAKFEATQQANVWLAKRLDELGEQLQDSERAVEVYRSQNGLQKSGDVTLNDQQLSELNVQLILARADAAAKRAKYDRAQQILSGRGNIESVSDVLQSSTISSLRSQQAELARQQADLSTKYGPRHPSILNIDAQRRDINRQISAEVQRIVGGISNEVTVADSRVKALEQSLDQMQNRAGVDNQAEVRLRELERQASANRTVYEAFLNRFKETGQQQDLQTADSRVISRAIAPMNPSYPKTNRLLLGALAVSFMLGGSVAFLLELLDNGITTPARIESALGVPLLVSIPMIPVEKSPDGTLLKPAEYILQKPLSAYSEATRSLRSTLALSNVDTPPKVILFTSSLPDEGKTTTSVSFARAAAQSGRKVLLVDCDLRHPSVHKLLSTGEPPKLGLVEVLAGNCSFAEAMLDDPETGLHYLSVAKGTVNPPDVLGSEQMRNLVARWRDLYDLIILDSPPVMPVVDSRVLGHLADKTVFIVRWQNTPHDAARTAMKELRHAKVDVVGAVLTLVDTASQAKYGYGGSGYYYGKYSRYYSN
tara:strand:+ start:99572 stop:101818 length:2247 start_codon:yes stop_codon:yes gene_type:complete